VVLVASVTLNAILSDPDRVPILKRLLFCKRARLLPWVNRAGSAMSATRLVNGQLRKRGFGVEALRWT
jgi:hypothetical protein